MCCLKKNNHLYSAIFVHAVTDCRQVSLSKLCQLHSIGTNDKKTNGTKVSKHVHRSYLVLMYLQESLFSFSIKFSIICWFVGISSKLRDMALQKIKDNDWLYSLHFCCKNFIILNDICIRYVCSHLLPSVVVIFQKFLLGFFSSFIFIFTRVLITWICSLEPFFEGAEAPRAARTVLEVRLEGRGVGLRHLSRDVGTCHYGPFQTLGTPKCSLRA